MAADDPTVYRIRNRWLGEQFLAERDGKAVYGTADEPAGRWVLEDVDGGQRVRNHASGALLAADGAGTVTLVPAAAAGATEKQTLWALDVTAWPWRALRNGANGKHLNCERKLGWVECDLAEAPRDDSRWSAQWEFVHVGGPPPARWFRPRQVAVTAPAYGATVRGATTIAIRAPGLASATARCWRQGPADGSDHGFGADALVATVALDADGAGGFTLPADDYPHGPLMVRITGNDGDNAGDTCLLQLYNAGGVRWNEGVPAAPPAAAAGLALAFSDDFDKPLSISKTGEGATYCSHKPGGGDFGALRFADHESGASPFLQVGSYLRIRADAKTNSAGLISSLRMDGSGMTVAVPCYFECRMTAQSAPGSWPAFWLMTRSVYKGLKEPADELDTIEAYGGSGPRNPNQTGYWTTTHFWNQGEEGKKQRGVYQQVPMTTIGGGASWFTTFHTYGTLITADDTVYYCDGVEVARHPTGAVSKREPWFFFLNLAVGGNGWPVDLSRYDGVVDMYVDWVRVYAKP